MKLIALMPVRNEARVLSTTLACLEQFCDHIILADQNSTDDTRVVARRYPKVDLIDNPMPPMAGPDLGRTLLLDRARDFDGNNLHFWIDADEIAPPGIFGSFVRTVASQFSPGTALALRWVQLWRSPHVFRDDQSVWSNSFQPMVFFDDRQSQFNSDRYFLHHGRLPTSSSAGGAVTKLDGFPVLHLQWAYWERTQYKQARYRMLEFVHEGFSNATRINARYAPTLGDRREHVSPVPSRWLEGVEFAPDLFNTFPCWQYDDIFAMFETYGIERFEPLQIWHLDPLRKAFLGRLGRKPKAELRKRRPRELVRDALPLSVRAGIRCVRKAISPACVLEVSPKPSVDARHCPLAVFTEPPSRRARLRHAMISALSPRRVEREGACGVPVGGHQAVTRSLLAGLRTLKAPFVYNPDLASCRADLALVLASPATLRQVLAWKANGGCQRVFAGPNLVVRPSDHDGILRSEAIDKVIVPSKWVADAYAAEAPELERKIVVWPAGVDAEWWAPPASEKDSILIYDKMLPQLADMAAKLARETGWKVLRIKYGKYSPSQFRTALARARTCVYLSESESQGIALAEAWSMNVPTLVLKRNERFISGLRMRVSVAPYLTKETGAFWETAEDLRQLLASLQETAYSPRQWLLDHMTDAEGARMLLDLARS